MEGKPPERKAALKSNCLASPSGDVNGLDSCPMAADTPAAISTYQSPGSFIRFSEKTKRRERKRERRLTLLWAISATSGNPTLRRTTKLRAGEGEGDGDGETQGQALGYRRVEFQHLPAIWSVFNPIDLKSTTFDSTDSPALGATSSLSYRKRP